MPLGLSNYGDNVMIYDRIIKQDAIKTWVGAKRIKNH